MRLSRREFAALPLFTVLRAKGQPPPPVLESKAYDFTSLPVRASESGATKIRPVLNGMTKRSRLLEIHITELAPGQAPHPPHQHRNEEIMMLSEGTLEVELHAQVGEFGHGEKSRIGPGSVIYLASDDPHGQHNVGQAPARYFVIALDRTQWSPTTAESESLRTLQSKTYGFSQMAERTSPNGAVKSRPVFNGVTTRGMHISAHLSELAAGQAPHPPERQPHEEAILLREGTLEVTLNGQVSTLGPGSVIYSAYNDLNGVRNVGTAPAKYFVFSMEG